MLLPPDAVVNLQSFASAGLVSAGVSFGDRSAKVGSKFPNCCDPQTILEHSR